MPLPRNCYRHLHGGFQGYRFYARRGGRSVQRYFSILEYGGWRRAKAALLAAYPALLAEAGAANAGPRPRSLHKTRVRAGSGVRGVLNYKGAWVAAWNDPAGVLRRVYCGHTLADFREAVRIRREAESLLEGGYSTRDLYQR